MSDDSASDEEIDDLSNEDIYLNTLIDVTIRNSFENFAKITSRKYQTYTKNEKNAVVHMYSLELNLQKEAIENNHKTSRQIERLSRKQTCKHLSNLNIEKFNKFNSSHLLRWCNKVQHFEKLLKTGPKINLNFEEELWGEIVLVQFKIHESAEGVFDNSVTIKENVAYNYDIIEAAGTDVCTEKRTLGK